MGRDILAFQICLDLRKSRERPLLSWAISIVLPRTRFSPPGFTFPAGRLRKTAKRSACRPAWTEELLPKYPSACLVRMCEPPFLHLRERSCPDSIFGCRNGACQMRPSSSLSLKHRHRKPGCSLGTRALTWVPQPGLRLARGDYRQGWDEVSQTYEQARVSVCATSNLEEYERSGADTAATIAGATQLGPSDTVLEIGCGTGRIGLHLAPLCGRWMGADVSRNMLGHARQAMNHLPNVSSPCSERVGPARF